MNSSAPTMRLDRGSRSMRTTCRCGHRAVLALARSGATEQAQALYRELGLEGRQETDIPELEARLLKDVALVSA